jgi:hypothetical protein
MASISLRVPDDDLAEIDRRAAARGLNRTEYMRRCALSDDLAETADEARFHAIEERLELLEAAWRLEQGAGTWRSG